MKKRDFQDIGGLEAIGFSHGQFGLVVQALHHAIGDLPLGLEPVED